ncbi:MAG: META domain-containing protein [Phocaeicola sp.]
MMKKNFLGMALFCFGAFAMTACGVKTNEASLDAIAGEWVIETIQGNPVSKTLEKTPFLGINADENRLYGTTGCNNINGLIKRDSVNTALFTFENVATTMMMCPEMETEQMVLGALSTVKKASLLPENKLSLLDASDKEVMQLMKK